MLWQDFGQNKLFYKFLDDIVNYNKTMNSDLSGQQMTIETTRVKVI